MTLDEINEQIAKLMQEKAEDQALAHYVAPRASSRFDYIMNGDRSGLDKFDASEQAYATMLAKQRMANDEAYKQRLFNELSKEADRLNTLKIAKLNKDNANDSKLEAIEKELNNLIITKETLEAAGKDSRQVTARINQIYEKYPQIERPNLGEYDPMKSFDYIKGMYGEYDSNNNMDELNLARKSYFNEDGTPKFKIPEFAKEIARLDKEIARRKKYDEQQEQIAKDLKEYIKSGTVSQLLYDVGFSEGGPANGRYLQRNGKGAKSYRKYSSGKGLPAPK